MTVIYTIVNVRLNSDNTATVSLQAADGSGSSLTISGSTITLAWVGRQVQAIWTLL